MTAVPLLSVRNLQVRYQRSIIGVHDVSFDVWKDSTVVILGANGAGKSTTLRAISGFIGLDDARVVRGQVLLDGRDITGWAPHRVTKSGIVLVPEREKVFPNLTVAENLTVVSTATSGRVLDLVYAFFPRLAELRRKEAGLLSGGERQMLAIGAALACEPRLLMIDELSLGLAPTIVKDLAEKLVAIRTELGLTILLVEQSAHTALAIADHACVLENGRVARSGTARDLAEDAGIQDYYLGGRSGERRSYRDVAMAGLEVGL